MRQPSPHSAGRPRRLPRLRWVLVALAVVVVGLVLLALPFLRVPGEARDAKVELEQALGALGSGDVDSAERSLARAREHVDTAQDATQGLGGDLWSRVPWLGSPVSDARHLTQALDHVTSAAEGGVAVYPAVSGDEARLFTDNQVDEETLREALDTTAAAGEDLLAAQEELEQVEASFPGVAGTLAGNRDAALAQVAGPAAAYERLAPVLDQLPGLFGFEGRRTYLIAMLNPAELRYSGGAPLAYAPMKAEDGKITTGASRTVARDPALRVEASWPRVMGNRFHDVRGRVSNATFAPSWSVSGEELLRAWKVTHDRRFHGVVAVDVKALAMLLGTTEGAEVPGYGFLTEDNLVETLVGSYDQYYPDPNAQDELNDGLIPVFKDLVFGGGGYLDKGRALGEAAAGRHFAVYLRDDAGQQAVSTLGLDGDLTRPEGDYVGVFTQNINGSKVDFYQKRNVALDVRLDADGTARNSLTTDVNNAVPAFPFPVADPGVGYFTRIADITVTAFLPPDARVTGGTPPGTPWKETYDFFDHAFTTSRVALGAGESATSRLSYEVPGAASRQKGGRLVYRLAVDPQGTVNPSTLSVQVQLPRGYVAESLPEGWTAGRDGSLEFFAGAFEKSTAWEIPLIRRS